VFVKLSHWPFLDSLGQCSNTCGLQLWRLILWVGHGSVCVADRLGKYFIPVVLVLLFY